MWCMVVVIDNVVEMVTMWCMVVVIDNVMVVVMVMGDNVVYGDGDSHIKMTFSRRAFRHTWSS